MSEKTAAVVYKTADEFFESPRKISVGERVNAKLHAERNAAVLDEAQIRQQEDWSHLASRIVGAENL